MQAPPAQMTALDSPATAQKQKIDIVVCIFLPMTVLFWLSIGKFPSGADFEFGHLAGLMLLGLTAANIVGWPRLLEAMANGWLIGFAVVCIVLILAGIMHGVSTPINFAMTRMVWWVIVICLLARRPNAQTIYWASVLTTSAFILAFLYSSNQAGLSIIQLYTEIFFKGNVYFGRDYYLPELARFYSDPMDPIGDRGESRNVFAYVTMMMTLLLLSTRHAVAQFRGKQVLDTVLIAIAASFCMVALTRSVMGIMFVAVTVTFLIASLRSGSLLGILGLLGISIFALMIVGIDAGPFEGIRDRLFQDQNSLDERSNMAEYAINQIAKNPILGSGIITRELDYAIIHNLYLVGWSAAGIFGLVAVLFYIGMSLYFWARGIATALGPDTVVNGWTTGWLHGFMLPSILNSFASSGLALGFNLLAVGIGLYAIDQTAKALKAKQAPNT